MNIYLGADHAGFPLKQKVFAHLSNAGYNVQDVGDVVLDPKDDYPQFAFAAATKVIGDTDPDARAILICGGGQGMAIAANRIHGIRAVVAWDAQEAKMSRIDNNANALALPARVLEDQPDATMALIDTWLSTPFSGEERHIRRLHEIEELYG